MTMKRCWKKVIARLADHAIPSQPWLLLAGTRKGKLIKAYGSQLHSVQLGC